MAISTKTAAAHIIEKMASTRPITGNDLQRALLACQIEYVRTYHRMLFEIPFIMWDAAPCDTETFRLYSVYGNATIPKAKISGQTTLPDDAERIIDAVCARIAASEDIALMVWYMTEVMPNCGGYHSLDMNKTRELADAGIVFKG